MIKINSFTKGLAITGAVLVWIPLIAPLLFSVVSLIADGRFRFDYLMPAEIFPVALVGGGLLIWAAFRTRARRALITGSLGLAIALLVGSQALAVVTGLASGEIEPAGWPFALVLSLFGAFVLALLVTAVGGLLLARDTFQPA